MLTLRKYLFLLLFSAVTVVAHAQTDSALVRVLTGYTYQVDPAIPGKRVYISCQRPINAQGEVVGKGDIGAQTTQIFENLKTALQRVGGSLTDVKQVSYRIRNLAQNKSAVFDQRVAAYLPQNPQLKEFKNTQNLLRDDMLLEIEVVAIID